MNYSLMSAEELLKLKETLSSEYNSYRSANITLDLSRGKPNSEQLDLSNELLVSAADEKYYITEKGFDCRNYGLGDGIPEMKRILSEIYDLPEQNIVVGGNSSLNMMFDNISRLLIKGTLGCEPWMKQGSVNFICPAPGYDRHFSMLETLGIELIPVDMLADGPDMDAVEKLVSDPLVKGLICVPKYSNPTGITFSDEVLNRLCSMKTAPDFRIIFDNAYAIHDIYDEGDVLGDIFEIAKKYGTEDRILYFSSTSKVSFPGSGIAFVSASDSNIKEIRQYMSMQTIGHDKLNQLRHVKYIKNKEGALEIMRKHAAIIRPRFDLCMEVLHKELDGLGIAEWYDPKGGYFISLNVLDGCAKRVWTLMKEAGVTMTGAGATFPGGIDPRDRNLRLAPTYTTMDDLALTLKILTCCVKLAAVEKLTK